jgi:uncharacterized membrane protein
MALEHDAANLPSTYALTRSLMATAAGAVAFAVAMAFIPWQAAVLVGWDAMSLVFLGWVIVEVWDRDAAATAAMATREDDSRAAADLLIVSASVVSLGAVGLGLIKAGQAHGATKAAITAVTVLSVFLAWGVVQTVFMLRYARVYYGGSRGIDFNEKDEPDFRDFAYLALTVGMTYQVSDTNLRAKPVRRTVTRHALLSYLFGTVVVAMMINVVASLLR